MPGHAAAYAACPGKSILAHKRSGAPNGNDRFRAASRAIMNVMAEPAIWICQDTRRKQPHVLTFMYARSVLLPRRQHSIEVDLQAVVAQPGGVGKRLTHTLRLGHRRDERDGARFI